LKIATINMKHLLFVFLIGYVFNAYSQIQSPDCAQAENVCGDNGSNFPLSIGGGFDDLPGGLDVSNPGFGLGPNNGNPNGSGCLNSNELNPNWFVINVSSPGFLEFTIGAAGNNGFYDWALWPYYENADGTSACNDITNNLLAPVACNWNGSSAGFTGMTQQGNLPPGANQANFEYGLVVNPGDAFVLCFSNFSGGTGLTQLTFGADIPGNPAGGQSASITCTPNTPDQTICLGESATVDIMSPANLANPSFNWLVTNGVSDITSGAGVIVTPAVTTEYYVEITDANLITPLIDTFTIFIENPPVPDAGIDQSLCLGDIINLNATPSDNANTVLWTYSVAGIIPVPVVGFTPNFSDPSAVVSVDQTGLYEFYFSESTPICAAVFDTVLITIEELEISASSFEPSCIGSSDGQIDITAAGAQSYSFDNGVTWQADSFAMVFAAGDYTVCVRSLLGCTKCTQVTVVDPEPITISVSQDTLICENGTGYLSASADGGTSYLFNWDFTSNTAATQSVNPSMNTIYSVFAVSEDGCVSPTETISVTIRPSLTGTITANDTICPLFWTDIIATVTGGIGAPYTYVWSNSDTYTGGSTDTISVSPDLSRTYSVTISDGCETTPLVMETNIRVAPLPIPQYEVLNPIQCETAYFDIVNTTDPLLSEFVYWSVDGDMDFVNQDTIYPEGLNAGNYELYMMVTSYEGCIDSIRVENALHVDPRPVANFHFSPDPITMFTTEVEFRNYSYDGYTYQWFFEGATPYSSTSEDVMVMFPDGEEGVHQVMLITTSELGCVDTLIRDVTIYPEVILYAPNTFTPDGDELNQDWRVYIEGVDEYDFTLLVFNRWGEIVWESHDSKITWDGYYHGKALPEGSYVWTIKAGDLVNDDVHIFNGNLNIIR